MIENPDMIVDSLERLFCGSQPKEYKLRLVMDECSKCDHFIPNLIKIDGDEIMSCKNNDVCYQTYIDSLISKCNLLKT